MVCPEHPAIETRLARIERMQWLIIGIGLGTGVLSLSQLLGGLA